MADSFIIYPGDGVQTDFPITFPYLDPSHVKVAVDGVDVPFTISGGNAVVSPAPADGLAVRVYRESGADLLVDYTVGVLTEEDLDTAYRHALFIATEARDVAEASIALDKDGKMDANDRVIKNLGYPGDATDAANKQYVDDRLAADIATVIANRNDALASRNAAASSQTAAANSASAAANSATNAAASATSANSSKNAAASSETNAASSASAAASSATSASNSAATATTQRGLAETARNDAQTARAGAEAARDAAIAARNTAETHKNAAAASASSASISAATATQKAAEAAASAAAAATFDPDTYYSRTETDALLSEKASQAEVDSAIAAIDLSVKADAVNPVLSGSFTFEGTDLTAELGFLNGVTSSIQSQLNSKVGASHGHTWADIDGGMAGMSAGSVGSLAFARVYSVSSLAFGGTTSGGNLRTANAQGEIGSTLSGTWRCLGTITNNASNIAEKVSLWVRIS